jgi:hypothetical protein
MVLSFTGEEVVVSDDEEAEDTRSGKCPTLPSVGKCQFPFVRLLLFGVSCLLFSFFSGGSEVTGDWVDREISFIGVYGEGRYTPAPAGEFSVPEIFRLAS